MHAHIHGHTCLRHTRTHTRSNATVVTGFCSSFPLAEFPFPLFSVPLVNREVLHNNHGARESGRYSWWLVHAALVPAPRALRRTNNEDDDAQRILCRAHIHDDKRSIFGDLYVSSEAWRALCGFRASQVRCDPLENGWDSYVMTPLIGQYSVSVTRLTNQLFVWILDLILPKECRHPIENEKTFPLMSNVTRYDEMKKNCGRSKMWWVMLPCTIQSWNGIERSLSRAVVSQSLARLRYHISNSVVFVHRAGTLAKG